MAKSASIHIRLEEDLRKELDKYAVIYKIPLSSIIRTALEEYAYKVHQQPTTVHASRIKDENF